MSTLLVVLHNPETNIKLKLILADDQYKKGLRLERGLKKC